MIQYRQTDDASRSLTFDSWDSTDTESESGEEVTPGPVALVLSPRADTELIDRFRRRMEVNRANQRRNLTCILKTLIFY
jgi:hypothetical protein